MERDLRSENSSQIHPDDPVNIDIGVALLGPQERRLGGLEHPRDAGLSPKTLDWSG